jgi:hypothetical protein
MPAETAKRPPIYPPILAEIRAASPFAAALLLTGLDTKATDDAAEFVETVNSWIDSQLDPKVHDHYIAAMDNGGGYMLDAVQRAMLVLGIAVGLLLRDLPRSGHLRLMEKGDES